MAELQGQNANRSGKGLENKVERALSKLGITAIMYSKLDTKEGRRLVKASKRGILLKHVPYTNMFGARAYGEFVLIIWGQEPIRIECRQQDVAGSVQDKLPKLLGDCECMDEKRVFIILEGNGVSPKAKAWLENSAKAIKFKKIHVKSFADFKTWTDDVLGGVSKVTKKALVIPEVHTLKRISRRLAKSHS